MSLLLRHHLLLFFLTLIPQFLAQNATVSCPLDFSTLKPFLNSANSPGSSNVSIECRFILQGLRLVQSKYIQETNSFLPPQNSSEACWDSYQTLIASFLPNFDIRKSCGFQTDWISEGCMNITTKSQFETLIPNSTMEQVVSKCNQSLLNGSPCAACTLELGTLQATYLTGNSTGNVSDCTAYPSIYAAAFANQYGPTDKGTAYCLFSLDYDSSSAKKKITFFVAVIGAAGVLLVAAICVCWFVYKKRSDSKKRKMKYKARNLEIQLSSGLGSMGESTNLVKFTFEEIKKATGNFSRYNIIGRGGYGNVYKGVLPDGSEVALKRFKNCSAAGDAEFTHEVEVIASVRHVNLVAMRGYCTATTPLEGHQRIIVCDLMRNGSLYDHLFGSMEGKLSWPLRQQIALGMARGLAYLHYGAQVKIIHRDIKASNILLDEMFEAKVADFGLAKFYPEGMTHWSTRVAGTMGYVAPEYALYGQLTERSDVYSFGVVLLELLSGKKALVMNEENQPNLVTDWAWSLVRKGQALDVLEDNMPEFGAPEVLEKFVLVGVLCSHPQLYARPTMDQVVKMLETDLSVPSIPERPIPLVAEIDDIERSVSSGSGQLSSPTGYQAFMFEKHQQSSGKQGETSSSS